MDARRLLASALMLGCIAASRADDLHLQRILVEGSRASQLGLADAANAGSIDARQLAARTIYRPGELLEAAPGLIASQHSGEGKANQFFLRGFNLDHGTDLRTTVDDMPVNQRSHAHGQGWTDLNFLIPELAARLDYRKGPYSAREGDFASAGSASIVYANRLARQVASIGAGQDGFARTLLAGSPEVGSGALLYALELLHNDGPFTQPDDYRKVNAVLRYSQGYANNGWSVSAMAYRGAWNASDQIPGRAVDAGLLGRFDTIDATDGGQARRYSLSGAWRRTEAASATKLNAYIIRNVLDLYSNFTYFLNDPVNGDQFSQPDRRVTSGAGATHTWHSHGAIASDVTLGLQLQSDNIVNGLYSTRARERLAVTRANHVLEHSLAAFAEIHARWSSSLRSTAGLRADAYHFDVRGEAVRDAPGKARSRQLSPSLSVVLGPWASSELYLNAGSGFHSNDARGVVAPGPGTAGPGTASPGRAGEGTSERGTQVPGAPGLARTRGLEAGVRTEFIPGLQSTLALYRLDIDSELVYVGDAGNTEAGPPSRRTGIELSHYYKPTRYLSFDADFAFARARSRGAASPANYIAGAVEGVGQLAVSLERGPWSGALRLRYFGPRPLVEDNSVRSQASSSVNGRIGYRVGQGLQLELEAFNISNRRAAAISYWYASRLRGEEGAREGLHFHPLEPRTFRLSLVKRW